MIPSVARWSSRSPVPTSRVPFDTPSRPGSTSAHQFSSASLLRGTATPSDIHCWMSEAGAITDEMRKRLQEAQWEPGPVGAQTRGISDRFSMLTWTLRPELVVETGVDADHVGATGGVSAGSVAQGATENSAGFEGWGWQRLGGGDGRSATARSEEGGGRPGVRVHTDPVGGGPDRVPPGTRFPSLRPSLPRAFHPDASAQSGRTSGGLVDRWSCRCRTLLPGRRPSVASCSCAIAWVAARRRAVVARSAAGGETATSAFERESRFPRTRDEVRNASRLPNFHVLLERRASPRPR
jgi:hypothetical protein